MEYDLGILSDWFRANKLSLNLTITNFIVFGKRNDLFIPDQIIFAYGKINRVSTTKFIAKLNWSKHIEYVRKEC